MSPVSNKSPLPKRSTAAHGLALLICLGIVSLFCFVAPATAEAGDRVRVRNNDTLSRISKRTGCSVSRIRKANRLKNDMIKPGQKLRLPKGCQKARYRTGGSRYVVRSKDTLARIAKRHGCRIRDLKKANRLKRDFIKPGQKLHLPQRCRGDDSPATIDLQAALEARALDIGDPIDLHVVAEGDTLETIAGEGQCAPSMIARANQLAPDAALEPGRELIIPPCIRVGGVARSEAEVDSAVLAKLMEARGFNAPRGFRAFVIEITLDEANEEIVEERLFDYGGQSDRLSGWNPASTVKIFPVIGALLRIRALGFTPEAKVTFFNRKTEITSTIREMVEETLINSDNMTYNRLTQLASFDYLNGELLNERNGFQRSAIMKAYEYPRWIRQGELRSLRESPPIKLEEGETEKTLASRTGTLNTGCYSSACTTHRDLAEAMRRMMLQEQLPADETFELHPDDLELLREALAHKRRRGDHVVDQFKAVFGDEVGFFHKPGYSEGWFSDNIYIEDLEHHRVWVVVMSAERGRKGLNVAARVLAHVLHTGELRAVP